MTDCNELHVYEGSRQYWIDRCYGAEQYLAELEKQVEQLRDHECQCLACEPIWRSIAQNASEES